ncbi:hypothetical protein BS78_05G200900 [Paspalum vaginatum]|nr:hypothetical protein BS78_05G200900 [Paspalum vaginatum]
MQSSAALLLPILVAMATPFLASHPVPVQSTGNAAACVPKERDALLAFKKGISSDPAGLLSSWQRGSEDDCCRWGGVWCSNRTGHVLKLQLRNEHQDDQGNLVAPMVGQISQSLLSLEYLEHLDLSSNSLTGPAGRIPEFLGSLKNLKHLNLSSMPFSGTVPSHLGNLSNLECLDLSYTGDTHSTDLSWIANLQYLLYLNLSGINLSAVSDWPHAVNMIPSLRVLELSNCALTSANESLPRLNLTNLEKLHLSYNYFEHSISSCWFWHIRRLKDLELHSTGLYGPFPNKLKDMTSLQTLDISQYYSDRSRKLTLATSLRNLCNLEFLYISNSLLYGDISELLESLPQCSPNRLRVLVLSQNNIHGVLPKNMWPLTSLEYLDLSVNNISGILPNWMGKLTRLQFLSLSGNNISGVLPNWMGNLTTLEFIDISINKIKGILPSWTGKLTSLYFLSFTRNYITGVLPSQMGQLTSLKLLDLSGNNIHGTLPNSMRKLTSLEKLDLSGNNISGIVPDWIGQLTSLKYLGLSHNNFFGVLPYQMGQLTSLEGLNLESNNIHGTLPTSLGQLTSLQYLDLSNNNINGTLPNWLGKLTSLEHLSLNQNNISGFLP